MGRHSYPDIKTFFLQKETDKQWQSISLSLTSIQHSNSRYLFNYSFLNIVYALMILKQPEPWKALLSVLLLSLTVHRAYDLSLNNVTGGNTQHKTSLSSRMKPLICVIYEQETRPWLTRLSFADDKFPLDAFFNDRKKYQGQTFYVFSAV